MFQRMSDTEDNGSIDDPVPGPSRQRDEARSNAQDDTFDYSSEYLLYSSISSSLSE